MKEIKFLISCLGGAAYASTWWLPFTVNVKLLPLPIILTVVLGVIAIFYLIANWSEG